MLYKFENFELDTDRRELRREGMAVETEPQVFDLLVLLASHHHRVVSKDEIIEKIWQGRFISDWAISSRIKTLRQALGDDGTGQRFIKTLRGKGFRFVQDVALAAPIASAGPPETTPQQTYAPMGMRTSIAVLPFQLIGSPGPHLAIADAIPRELIASLSSLRWIKVFAHGSTFRFRGDHIDVGDVGSILGAHYALTGSVEVIGSDVIIDTELSGTHSREVIWALRRQRPLDQVQELRAEIAAQVIAVAEFGIPQHEASLLQFNDASDLDAWSAMHIGIQQMNRLNPKSLDLSLQMFERAITLDPTLTRAHAGKSFVHFLNAFLKYKPDRDSEVAATIRAAEMALELQPQDPFANFVMGRSFWLQDNPESSKPWFARALSASPNYALGYFAASWADIFTKEYSEGDSKTDKAMDLSPLDPMLGGMLCNKMWVAIARDDIAEAVKWSEQTARTPGTHAGMMMFAAMANLLAGDETKADMWKAEALRRNPDLRSEHMKTLIPSSHQEFQSLIDDAARRLKI